MTTLAEREHVGMDDAFAHALETPPMVGLELTPLVTPRKFSEEGLRMRHCAGSYVARAGAGACFIFHVDFKGAGGETWCGTAEFLPSEHGMVLGQLRGRANLPAPNNVRGILEQATRHMRKTINVARESIHRRTEKRASAAAKEPGGAGAP